MISCTLLEGSAKFHANVNHIKTKKQWKLKTGMQSCCFWNKSFPFEFVILFMHSEKNTTKHSSSNMPDFIIT